jgi:hypothetical protein
MAGADRRVGASEPLGGSNSILAVASDMALAASQIPHWSRSLISVRLRFRFYPQAVPRGGSRGD